MPQPPIILRPYHAADAAQLAQLYFESARELGVRAYTLEQVRAWAPEPASAERVHARAGDGRLTLLAVDGRGEVLAYGDLEADGHIDHLYCRPDAAGQGLGSQLIDALTAHALAVGLPRLFVEASELARPVFERKGFAVTARRDFEVGGVPIHNYAMERRLD